jgi:hypothetical protein
MGDRLFWMLFTLIVILLGLGTLEIPLLAKLASFHAHITKVGSSNTTPSIINGKQVLWKQYED